jgi:hypothetical protein
MTAPVEAEAEEADEAAANEGCGLGHGSQADVVDANHAGQLRCGDISDVRHADL